MNIRRTLWIGVGLFFVFGARASNAGTLDHLLCHRTRDPLKLKIAVDMIADIQPEFTAQGCVLVKPFEFCVPATKNSTLNVRVDG